MRQLSFHISLYLLVISKNCIICWVTPYLLGLLVVTVINYGIVVNYVDYPHVSVKS